jgi:uncharacterized protein (TIGR03790 family)
MRCFLVFVVILMASSAVAQGPHEVLLLVNSKSSDSVEIAESWAKSRGVPSQNILKLDLPQKYADGELTISHADFTELIWTPALKAVKKRGLEHVLAWVYSTGFPVSISGKPVVSILGITFLSNRWPTADDVNRAGFKSPLFSGRENASGGVHFPQSLSKYKRLLRTDMPLPCMMLGYIGKRGNTKQEVLACLKRGVESDGKKMDGTVYFVETGDVRSDARKWQFPFVQRELEMMGVNSVITNSFPRDQKDVMGVMMGSASFDTSSGNSYASGAMAEHLTSSGAVFQNAGQTKITEWIKAGVTASSGTVTEPFAIWAKFPDARFYVYYAAGCSMLESFSQAVRCPLQLLVIGDPLARPWAESAEIILDGIDGVFNVKNVELSVDVKGRGLDYYGRVIFLVDGRIVGKTRKLDLSAEKYEDGHHVLRVVAYRTGMVENQVFRDYGFRVKKSRLSFE